MSKYNEYAERVNRAFIKAKREFDDAYREYQKAQEKLADLERAVLRRERAEEFPGENKIALAKARGEWEAMQFKMEQVRRTAFPKFEDQLKEIEKELHAAYEANQRVNPDDIDSNTMMLINSGIISGSDIEPLLQRFRGNATMRRLLLDYAGKKMRELDDLDPDQAKQFRVVKAFYNSDSDVIARFNDLKGVAMIYSGALRRHTDSYDFIHHISDEWMKAAVQETIENF